MTDRNNSASQIDSGRRNAIRLVGGAAALAASGGWKGAIAQSKRTKIGFVLSLGALPILVAIEEGYFKEQGVDAEIVPFDSGAILITAVSTNQLDVGQGAASAGLWNAIGRGIPLTLVADSAHSNSTPPGYPSFGFMVRKALIDSGRVKEPADLKGLKFTMPAPGIGAEVELGIMLKQGGLTKQDLQISYMGLADAATAMATGAIDFTLTSEPFISTMLTQGTGVMFRRSDQLLPGGQIGIVIYSPEFAKSDLAIPWMMGYLRGVRLYNDAIVKKIPAAREKLFTTAIKHFPIKDRARYENFMWQGIHPDGLLNTSTLNLQQDVYIASGAQQTRVDANKAIDMRFANTAVSRLGGPYR